MEANRSWNEEVRTRWDVWESQDATRVMLTATRDKAVRYLTERRVTITKVAGNEVCATVRGTSVYVVHHDEHLLRWRCSCPARRRCSHIAAVELVTAPVAEVS